MSDRPEIDQQTAEETGSALRKMGPKLLVRGLILICVLVGAAFLIESYRFEYTLSLHDALPIRKSVV